MRIVAFDKTGTLTLGKPALARIVPAIGTEAERLAEVVALQAGSEHPLAEAARRAANGAVARGDEGVTDFRALPGRGVSGSLAGRSLVLGSARLMAENDIPLDGLASEMAVMAAADETVSFLAETAPRRRLLAVLGFTDTIKPGAAAAVRRLHAMGLRTMMLTGDSEAAARWAGERLGIDSIQAGILPADKAAAVAALKRDGTVVAMVGDGINDAPALAAADVGIAMGTGADIAMQTAGITLMRGDPSLVADAIAISRRTVRKIWQGLFWAFGYNVLGIPLAAFGYLSPVLAGGAMALSSVSVVANALLLRRWRPIAEPQK